MESNDESRIIMVTSATNPYYSQEGSGFSPTSYPNIAWQHLKPSSTFLLPVCYHGNHKMDNIFLR